MGCLGQVEWLSCCAHYHKMVGAMVWMCLPEFMCLKLNPQCDSVWRWDLNGRRLGQEGSAILNRLMPVSKGFVGVGLLLNSWSLYHLPCESPELIHSTEFCSILEEENGFIRHQPCWHFGLRLSNLQNWANTFYFFINYSLPSILLAHRGVRHGGMSGPKIPVDYGNIWSISTHHAPSYLGTFIWLLAIQFTWSLKFF